MSKKQALGPNQQAWIAALRSGKYKQGIGFLRTAKDRYCCLGVGCDLLGLPYQLAKHLGTDLNHYLYSAGSTAVAPPELIEHLALRDMWGSCKTGGGELTWMNDNDYTFKEIADRVEANPADYFKEPK